MSTSHGCVVQRFTCRTEGERLRLAELFGIASADQGRAFIDVYPWETQCSENRDLIHYVSLKQIKRRTYPVVCGWMTVELTRKFGEAYIKEITSRNATDSAFKGVGFALLAALEADYPKTTISLYPLNDRVAAIYQRWGFKSYSEKLPYLFYGPPPRTALITMLEKKQLKQDKEDAEESQNIIEMFKSLLQSKMRSRLVDALRRDPRLREKLVGIASAEDDPEMQREHVANLL